MNRKLALLALATTSVVGVAVAASAHYVRGPFASLNSPTVTVNWKEAGLGDTTWVNYRADAHVDALYQCVNNGGNCPAAANKQGVSANVSSYGAFQSQKNGSIIGSLALSPPTSTLNCPGGQHRELVTATYTNIRLSDLTNGVLDVPTTPSSLGFSGFECP